MVKRALILGIGGQDGSYLAELLLAKGYEVHGLVRRSSVDNLWRIAGIRDRVTLHQGDLLDTMSLHNAIGQAHPHEIYNEADQDHVGFSREAALYSTAVTFGGVANLLEVLLSCVDWAGQMKVFQPLSSTMFGMAPPPQDENTPLAPASPYACAKAGAWMLCKHYRREHGLDVRCGIMFNHDSPRRGPGYLLGEIVNQALAVRDGKRKMIELRNLDLRVDIGHARDFMEGAWQIMQLDKPDDYVLATGKGWTIRELAERALIYVGMARTKIAEPKQKTVEPELIGDTALTEAAILWHPTLTCYVLEELIEAADGTTANRGFACA